MLHPDKNGTELKKPVLRVHEKIQGKFELFEEAGNPQFIWWLTAAI